MSTTTSAVMAPAPTIADAWVHVEIALYDHFHNPDVEGARAFYAAIAAHDLPGQPVWPMIVAPASNMKTEMIKPTHGLPNFHLIDSITPNTFLSGRAAEKGQQKGKDGLLQRIGTRPVILFPDFSTLLESNADKRNEVFAQLRVLYDGHFRKEFGIEFTDASVCEWNGRLTFGVAVTPEIDNYTSVFRDLGDRFVMIRWSRVGGVEAGLTALHQDLGAKDAAMKAAVHGLFRAMAHAPVPQLDPATERAIAATAEIVALGRASVKRDRNGQVETLPQPEGIGRLAQQFCQLAKGSARLDGREVGNGLDLALVHRVALDTLPPQRAALIRAVLAGKSPARVDMPRSTRARTLDDLEHVGLLDEEHRLTKTAHELFRVAGLLTV